MHFNENDERRLPSTNREEPSLPETTQETVLQGEELLKPGRLIPHGKNFPLFLFFLFVLSCLVLRPLAYGIAWGTLFAFLWSPVQRKLCRTSMLKNRPNLCAATSTLLLLVSCTIPLVLVLQAIFIELFASYESFSAYLAGVKQTGLPSITSLLPEGLSRIISPLLADRERITSLLFSLTKTATGFLQDLSANILQRTGTFLFQGFVAVLTMFFMIRDGKKVVAFLKDLIPLPRDAREKFVEDTGGMMKSVAYGVILTVGLQAALGGIGWKLCRLPGAYLASVAMFLFGIFPVGTAVVWLPGAIYLFLTGATIRGFALLAWGTLAVASIDNLLRPILIRGGKEAPTLAVMLGLVGGVAVWGLLGVFLGPIVLVTFIGILDLYRKSLDRDG